MNHHHPTDGLIFCPDSPYEFGTQQSLMKWKFVDKLTVDLRIEFVRNAPSTLLLWCNGRRDPFTAHMLPEDMYHLQKELASVSHGQAVIGEFGSEGQQWRFHLIRKDKNEPNHVNTVNDTLAAIEENLTALVLQAAFASQTAPQR
jgi:mRNA guanylyltransferase